MIKIKQRVFSLLMAATMLFVFCVPTFASTPEELEITKFSDQVTNQFNLLQEQDDEISTYAGRVFSTSAVVYAVNRSTGYQTKEPVAEYAWPNGNALAKINVPQSVYNQCVDAGLNEWYVTVNFNIQGAAQRATFYVNNQVMVNQAVSAGSYKYTYVAPLARTSEYKITLDGTGATCWGTISVQ